MDLGLERSEGDVVRSPATASSLLPADNDLMHIEDGTSIAVKLPKSAYLGRPI